MAWQTRFVALALLATSLGLNAAQMYAEAAPLSASDPALPVVVGGDGLGESSVRRLGVSPAARLKQGIRPLGSSARSKPDKVLGWYEDPSADDGLATPTTDPDEDPDETWEADDGWEYLSDEEDAGSPEPTMEEPYATEVPDQLLDDLAATEELYAIDASPEPFATEAPDESLVDDAEPDKPYQTEASYEPFATEEPEEDPEDSEASNDAYVLESEYEPAQGYALLEEPYATEAPEEPSDTSAALEKRRKPHLDFPDDVLEESPEGYISADEAEETSDEYPVDEVPQETADETSALDVLEESLDDLSPTQDPEETAEEEIPAPVVPVVGSDDENSTSTDASATPEAEEESPIQDLAGMLETGDEGEATVTPDAESSGPVKPQSAMDYEVVVNGVDRVMVNAEELDDVVAHVVEKKLGLPTRVSDSRLVEGVKPGEKQLLVSLAVDVSKSKNMTPTKAREELDEWLDTEQPEEELEDLGYTGVTVHARADESTDPAGGTSGRRNVPLGAVIGAAMGALAAVALVAVASVLYIRRYGNNSRSPAFFGGGFVGDFGDDDDASSHTSRPVSELTQDDDCTGMDSTYSMTERGSIEMSADLFGVDMMHRHQFIGEMSDPSAANVAGGSYTQPRQASVSIDHPSSSYTSTLYTESFVESVDSISSFTNRYTAHTSEANAHPASAAPGRLPEPGLGSEPQLEVIPLEPRFEDRYR